MFDDYKKWVLADYDQKKAAGALSPELMHTTPANLKAECIKVCEERFNKKDELLLRSFIGQKEDAAAYRTGIRNDNADKFRPLSNFLKQRSIQTDERNIELLAWLIGFEPRPYKPGMAIPSLNKGHQGVVATGEGPEIPGSEEPQKINAPVKEPSMSMDRRVLIILLLLALGGGAIYWTWIKPPTKGGPPRVSAIVPGKCMYWAGNNYLPGPCGQPHGDTPVVALDTLKLLNLKKITDWGSLSKNSIKKVWYAKVNGKIEIYTDSGFYPVDTNRRLLPLTKYMLDKYVLHK